MKLSEIGELSLLAGIRERFGVDSKEVIAGIGDDSAVIASRSKNLLMTTDMMMEGVHFDLSYMTPYQLGFKIVSVNVSDIYAMGGTPQFMLLDAAMKRDADDRFVGSFLSGIQDAMKMYRVVLIGGDLSAARSDMAVAATLIGYAKRPVMRSGANAGDKIYVTGTLGDSACGLELLKRIKKPVPTLSPRGGGQWCGGSGLSKPGLAWKVVEPLIRRHLMPEARDPKKFSRAATAMIDISDGLFIDLSRLCDESNAGARIYMKNIPVSKEMKKAASFLKLDPYELATSGGEDYELLFTALPSKRVDAVCIGEITESERTVVDVDNIERPLLVKGYQHWR